MIRRTTPNKSFIEYKRHSSCCSWSQHEQVKNQLRIKLPQKTPPFKLSHNTSRCSSKEEIKDQNVYETPRKVSQQVWKSSGNSNEIIWRTPRATTDRKQQPLITLPSSQAAKNPLERLQKLHKTNNKVGQKLSVTTPTNKPIFFTYLTPKKQLNIREDLSTAVATVQKSEQRLGLEENTLCKEIQTFRRQYQQLLRQYNQLKQKKQTNLFIYKDLLPKIKAKQEEIAALQRLRREEIQGLRLQIEEVIAEREHVLGESVQSGV